MLSGAFIRVIVLLFTQNNNLLLPAFVTNYANSYDDDACNNFMPLEFMEVLQPENIQGFPSTSVSINFTLSKVKSLSEPQTCFQIAEMNVPNKSQGRAFSGNGLRELPQVLAPDTKAE